MAIRRHIDYDSSKKEYVGYLDLGTGPDLNTEAKEALVFMLVGISGSWKAPVAYFFTSTLTAECQGRLVHHIVDLLDESGFHVCAITMDGHATNVGMASLLGAVLNIQDEDSLKPYFETDTGKKVYVIFDLCHMIKLLRNTLHFYEKFVSSSGTISWAYINNLHQLQKDSGLRLGNRLTNAHVHFDKQKMKVSLAVQVFSSSVSKALLTLKELGLPGFEDVHATVEFIEVNEQ